MPRRRVIPTVLAVSLFLGICTFVVVPLTRMARQWSGFVYRAKSTVNPIELRNWAGDLVEAHPDDYYDAHGTNVPPAVAALFPHRPSVTTIPGRKVVIVAWGRGFPSILVGPSDYAFTNRPTEILSPGVYLAKPYD